MQAIIRLIPAYFRGSNSHRAVAGLNKRRPQRLALPGRFGIELEPRCLAVSFYFTAGGPSNALAFAQPVFGPGQNNFSSGQAGTSATANISANNGAGLSATETAFPVSTIEGPTAVGGGASDIIGVHGSMINSDDINNGTGGPVPNPGVASASQLTSGAPYTYNLAPDPGGPSTLTGSLVFTFSVAFSETGSDTPAEFTSGYFIAYQSTFVNVIGGHFWPGIGEGFQVTNTAGVSYGTIPSSGGSITVNIPIPKGTANIGLAYNYASGLVTGSVGDQNGNFDVGDHQHAASFGFDITYQYVPRR